MVRNHESPDACAAQKQAPRCAAFSNTPLANCAAALTQQLFFAYQGSQIDVSVAEDKTSSPGTITICTSYPVDFVIPQLVPCSMTPNPRASSHRASDVRGLADPDFPANQSVDTPVTMKLYVRPIPSNHAPQFRRLRRRDAATHAHLVRRTWLRASPGAPALQSRGCYGNSASALLLEHCNAVIYDRIFGHSCCNSCLADASASQSCRCRASDHRFPRELSDNRCHTVSSPRDFSCFRRYIDFTRARRRLNCDRRAHPTAGIV